MLVWKIEILWWTLQWRYIIPISVKHKYSVVIATNFWNNSDYQNMDKENGDNNEKGKGGGHSGGGGGQDPSSLLDAASLFGKSVYRLY